MDRFGGSVRSFRNKGGRPFFSWSATGNRALRVILAVDDHLIVKKAQAALVLLARDLPPGRQREGVVAELSSLKHHYYETK